MRVCLGGTFHPFHAGHEALLRAATVDADAVFVGITDGDLSFRDRPIPPWQERAAVVEAYLKSLDWDGTVATNGLVDGVGPAASKEYDAIVVSPETVPGAHAINAKREKAGLRPLQVRTVAHVQADDRMPISATRIDAGAIDREGRRLRPVEVVVGSANPVKVAGVAAAFQAFLPETNVHGTDVASGVPEQPRGDETLAGARARAVAAMEATGADYAVGVEAGLNQDSEGSWYDVQAVVVLDANGFETTGWGPAFRYPDWVRDRALAGDMISDILGPVAGDSSIGGTTGAIGWMTEGAMDRTELTRVGVLAALAPRWKPELALPQS